MSQEKQRLADNSRMRPPSWAKSVTSLLKWQDSRELQTHRPVSLVDSTPSSPLWHPKWTRPPRLFRPVAPSHPQTKAFAISSQFPLLWDGLDLCHSHTSLYFLTFKLKSLSMNSFCCSSFNFYYHQYKMYTSWWQKHIGLLWNELWARSCLIICIAPDFILLCCSRQLY